MSNPLRKLVPAPEGAGAASAVAPRADRLSTRVHDLLHSNATLGPLIVLVIAVVIFSVVADRFLEARNFSLIVQQVMVVGTLGIAQTLVILTAGIDLSVGAIMVLSSIVMAKVSADHGVPGLPALVIGFGVGTACGLINGMLVTRLRLPPFIVTLGTFNVFFALNLAYSDSATIRGTDMSDLLLWTGNTVDVGDTRITYGSLLMLVLFGVFWWVLKNTAWGRHVYATGDDAEAARLAGVRTNRVLLSVYVVAGLICAVAAWMLIGRIASSSAGAAW
jgi:fructose transport system permease protein